MELISKRSKRWKQGRTTVLWCLGTLWLFTEGLMRMGWCYLIHGCITLNYETGVGSTLARIQLAVLLVILRCVQFKLNSHKNRLPQASLNKETLKRLAILVKIKTTFWYWRNQTQITRTWRESTVSVERTQTGIHKVCFKSLSWFLTITPSKLKLPKQ